MIKGIVDRFEGDFVIIEINGKTEDIKRTLVDDAVKVSDVVILQDGMWSSDKAATKKRKEEIQSLMDQVWED